MLGFPCPLSSGTESSPCNLLVIKINLTYAMQINFTNLVFKTWWQKVRGSRSVVIEGKYFKVNGTPILLLCSKYTCPSQKRCFNQRWFSFSQTTDSISHKK